MAYFPGAPQVCKSYGYFFYKTVAAIIDTWVCNFGSSHHRMELSPMSNSLSQNPNDAMNLSASMLASTAETALRQLGVPQVLAEYWAGCAQRQIGFTPSDPVFTDNLALALTKFGGDPDLSSHDLWPFAAAYSKKPGAVDAKPRPLDFLCQINLEDVTWVSTEEFPVPKKGLLSVFYDSEEQPWGYDPKQASGARLIYTPPGAVLRKIPAASYGFSEPRPVCAVRSQPQISLPDYLWLSAMLDQHGNDQADELSGLLEEFYDEDEGIHDVNSKGHCFGGYPVHIQNEMRDECQLASNGIYCGEPNNFQTPQALALIDTAHIWEILLQLNSEDKLGWQWGDSGQLYWWARKADIAAGELTKGWTVLQCY
jgi:uncharacterized protein YwqG